MEKERIEEAAKKYAKYWELIHPELNWEDILPIEVSELDFKEGAKWMQERMYSEEEILDIFHKFSTHLPFHYEFLVKTHFKKN